ncbi:MAG: hypothetical protein ACJA2D_002466 [Pseudohongiellaceae bacterium]|jgi:hypothetical protein|tara:strand:+ start:313 stop:444 length:132 start_codon:yes stop_codon:yes gene_type:complete
MKLLLGQLNELAPSGKVGLTADMNFTEYTPKACQDFFPLIYAE